MLPLEETDVISMMSDALRAAYQEKSTDAAMSRGVREFGQATGFDYVAIALLDRSGAAFEYKYEWSAEGAPPLAANREVVARAAAASMARLQRFEVVANDHLLLAPFVTRGTFTGFTAAMHCGRARPWSAVGKATFHLIAEVLIARLTQSAAERELQLREKQLHLVLQATNDAVYEWRVGAPAALYNDAVLELTGDPPETFDNSLDGWSNRVVPEDRDRFLSGIESALDGNEPAWTSEYRIRRHDGRVIWIRDRACILRDATGRAVRMIGAMGDVTDRHEAEQARIASDERYRRLIDQADDLILSHDQQGRITSLNRAFHTITGWTRASWMGRDVGDVLDPGDTVAVHEIIEEIRAGAKGVSRQLRLLKRSGDPVEMEVTISPVVENGVIAGASWIGRDVTQRNRDQRDREELSKRLEMLLESTWEGIIAVDENGMVYLVNRSACRILGCEPLDLIGRRLHDFVHPHHHAEQQPYAHRLCSLGALLEMQLATPLAEEVFTRFDGQAIPVRYAGSSVEGGTTRGAVVTFTDATERKLLENELQRANRMASLGHVAATIAHEFNNVLMGIQPYVDLIARRATSGGDLDEPLSRITGSIRRGKRIALEILRFIRPLEVALLPIEVQQWLRGFSDEARTLMGASRTLLLDLPDEPLHVRADTQLLHQVFVNLVSNARDAMSPNGTLRISVQRATAQQRFNAAELIAPDRFLRIAVADDGHGMPEETRKHVFEPLFTTKKRSGTGLGLAVVHQIVTAHGGYIFVESQPDVGTTFSIFLPLTSDVPAVEEAASIEPAPPAACRVLLIEDDDAVAAGIMAMLDMIGIESEVVMSGRGAAMAVEQFRPDVAVLDVGLPDIDGREVFRQLRARWPDLPIIFSTGHADTNEVASAGLRVRVLQKPYETSALLRAIAELTEEIP